MIVTRQLRVFITAVVMFSWITVEFEFSQCTAAHVSAAALTSSQPPQSDQAVHVAASTGRPEGSWREFHV